MLPPPPVVRRWLWLVAALTAAMVVVGGYVRLSRAGLSIVEWNVITGVLPPIGDAAWGEAFARYQQSPEGRTVNAAMTLDGYQRIFLIEWFHRLLARLAGLAVVLPLVAFIARGTIPWRRSLPYWGVVAGFGFQGLLGWLMVASGLVDRPSVSHYRLTAHLLAALALMATCIWLATMRPPSTTNGDARAAGPADAAPGTTMALRPLGRLLLLVVVLQIAWGGLMAGLKAGHISATWPLMLGQLMPKGMFATASTPWASVLAMPLGVHWVHRWLAWLVLAVAVALALAARRAAAERVARLTVALAALVALQIAVGVGVVVMHVPLHLALFHQATGVAILALAVFAYRQLPRATP